VGQVSAALDLNDHAALSAWLASVESAVDDVVGVAEDQLRPVDDRDLGRRQARRLLSDGRATLCDLVALARASLPPVK